MSISLFRTATKILLAFISRAAWQHRYYSTKVGHNWRKDVLEGHAPFYFNFSAKMFARLTLQFLFTYICICNRVRSVSFSNGGLRDRDIIFRDETDLVFCFFSCLVKFPAREANSWRRRASPNPGNWVCVFFSFFPHPTALAFFSRSNAHTHTNKEGAKTRGKAERRQRAVRFSRFVDYRLMFDSGCSFSLKNDLIRPSY